MTEGLKTAPQRTPPQDQTGKRGGCGCTVCPTRYSLAFLGALGLLCAVGFRKCFAIVLTHLAAEKDSPASQELFFPNCTVFNTSRDLHVPMGERTMFLLHSSYYVTNPLIAVAAAVLATKVSAVYMVACAVSLSSVLTLILPHIIQTSMPWLFGQRLLQGFVDGVQQPCTTGVLSTWATAYDKARLISIYYTGAYAAPALAALLSGLTICYLSWNSILYIYGACGVLWSLMWVTTAYDSPKDHPSLSDAEAELHRTHGLDRYHIVDGEHEQTASAIPWRHILKSPAVWSIILALFCHTHVYSMLMVEQAQYFSDSFNILIADIGLLTTLPHVGLSLSCLLGGLVSDRLLHLGLSITFTRKLLFSVGKGVEGACLVGLYFTGDWRTAVTLITLSVSVGGLAESGYQPIPADIAPQFAGVLCALASVGSLGAFANTIVASFVLGNSKTLPDWQSLFLISGVLDLVVVVLFDVMATAELQPWASGTPTATKTTTTSRITTTAMSSKSKSPSPFSDGVKALLRILFQRGGSVEPEKTVLILPKRSSGSKYGEEADISSCEDEQSQSVFND